MMRSRICFFLLLLTLFGGQAGCWANSDYVVSTFDPSHIIIPKRTEIDTSQYSAENVREKLKNSVAGKKAGTIQIRQVKGIVEMRAFYSGEGIYEMGLQQGNLPEAIYLEGGVVTLEQISSAFPKLMVKQGPHSYLCRRPLVVGKEAILVIENSSLKLSTERGAFLANGNFLFFIDGELTGWREKTDEPAVYSGDAKSFRPFLVSWGGGETYFCNVKASHLGYSHTKSFGITFSTYIVKKNEDIFHDPERDFTLVPHGWLINSTFSDIYYGFYCYEAEDIVVYNNTYVDNIIYGIDPHDRSKGLIIAGNNVSGTKKKHGIIMSRDVTDSFILDNESYNNKISGIMLDRQCVRNEISGNVVYKNGEDGLSFYESGNNLLYGNIVLANNAHGIRLRNSKDVTMINNVVVNNGKYGIYLHTRELSDKTRNLQIDPYMKNVSGSLIGGTVGYNLSGSLYLADYDEFTLYKVLIENRNNGKFRLGGDLRKYHNQVVDTLAGINKGLLLTRYREQ